MLEKQINETKQKIDKLKAKIEFVGWSLHYPNHPLNLKNNKDDYSAQEVDIFISNITRYSKRTLYFARNFLEKLIFIINKGLDDLEYFKEDGIGTMIEDDIFSEFDAFIAFSKSIMEVKKEEIIDGKKFNVDKNRGMTPNSKKHFDLFGKKVFNSFIKPYLNDIRNEAIHLNKNGTGAGSMLNISKKDKNIFINIKTTFHLSDDSGNKKDIDLIELFFFLSPQILEIIDKMLGFIILHYFEKWGVPENNQNLMTNFGNVSFDDFEIPGYKGIKKI